MELDLLRDSFTFCKVPPSAELPLSHPYAFLSVTDTERSLLCPTDAVPVQALDRSDGWRGFRVYGTRMLDTLADITRLLTENDIPIRAVSTCSTEYFFVPGDRFEEAVGVLYLNEYHIAEAMV